MKPLWLFLAFAFLAFSGGEARADCGTYSPGAIVYNASEKIFQYCAGTVWERMNQIPGSGSGGCIDPSADEGRMVYNETQRVMQGCAGNVWRGFGPVGGKSKWVSVSAGGMHTCGVKVDGTLWCWGADGSGQLGNGAAGSQTSPMQESTGAADWVQVAAGNSHTCAVKTGGTLWCWGGDGNGQLGNGAVEGNQVSPMQVGMAVDWASVSAGGAYTCAVKTGGTLWCWGADGSGQLGNGAVVGNQVSPMQVGMAVDWASVSAGNHHTCAVKTGGTLWCWGGDGNGQLGNGAAGGQTSPMQESTGAADWASVSAGNNHTCAVKAGGTLWCWGADGSGQLGNGAAGSQTSPMQESTGAADWVQVAAGNSHTCAVKTGGTLWCWGSDDRGGLGNGPITGNQDSPVQIGSESWQYVSAKHYYGFVSCGIKHDGILQCWGYNMGGLGSGVVNYRKIPTAIAGGALWKEVSTGSYYACAIKSDETLWCWGYNSYGGLGNNYPDHHNQGTPVQVDGGGTWKAIDTARYHTCGIKTDGTLWCWGRNSSGQLGSGAAGDQGSPVQESTGATNWRFVATGDVHTCAVKVDGTLWCWGWDGYGQLGNGAAGDQTSPVQVGGDTWKKISAGSFHTCGIKSDDTLWCWGENKYGKTGLNTVADTTADPTQISGGGTWKHITAGFSESCGIKTDGTLWCWGNNWYGQLGDGAGTYEKDNPVPVAVSGGGQWLRVETGNSLDYQMPQTCGIKSDNSLWCWGAGYDGQLGNEAYYGTDSDIPVQVSGAGTWQRVDGHDGFSCGIISNGTLYCWGDNHGGQLTNTELSAAYHDSPVSTLCSLPAEKSGSLLYNTGNDRMQYCDGVSWVKVGR